MNIQLYYLLQNVYMVLYYRFLVIKTGLQVAHFLSQARKKKKCRYMAAVMNKTVTS